MALLSASSVCNSHKNGCLGHLCTLGNSLCSAQGVGWDDAKGCWKAELWDGDGYDLLGHFDTEEAAARAYDR